MSAQPGAATAVDEVTAVVGRYVEGSRTGDVALLRSIFHPTAGMYGFVGDQQLTGTPEPFFDMVEKAPAPDAAQQAGYDGVISDVVVRGDTATAVLTEQGFFGMNFVDCFQLMRVDGEWLIVAKLFRQT